jgi:cytochrome c oxidase cbb3-type subunit III
VSRPAPLSCALAAALAALALVAVAGGCERERRDLGGTPASARPVELAPESALYPGAPATGGEPLDPALPGYAETAYAVSEGQVLYQMFNCGGCHATGGGGAMGPPLIDNAWRYGSAPRDVASSIVAGRPDGMPAYRGKLARPQLHQLVAFVRALGGLVRTDALPARDDHAQRTRSLILRDRAIPAPGREAP